MSPTGQSATKVASNVKSDIPPVNNISTSNAGIGKTAATGDATLALNGDYERNNDTMIPRKKIQYNSIEYFDIRDSLKANIELLTKGLYNHLVCKLFDTIEKIPGDSGKWQLDSSALSDAQNALVGDIDYVLDELFKPFNNALAEEIATTSPKMPAEPKTADYFHDRSPSVFDAKARLRGCLKEIVNDLFGPFLVELNAVFSTSQGIRAAAAERKILLSQTAKNSLLTLPEIDPSLNTWFDSKDLICLDKIPKSKGNSRLSFPSTTTTITIPKIGSKSTMNKTKSIKSSVPSCLSDPSNGNVTINEIMLETGEESKDQRTSNLRKLLRNTQWPRDDREHIMRMRKELADKVVFDERFGIPLSAGTMVRIARRKAKQLTGRHLLLDIEYDDSIDIAANSDIEESSAQNSSEGEPTIIETVRCSEKGCNDELIGVHQLNAHMIRHGIFPHLCHICNEIFDENLYGTQLCSHQWDRHLAFSGDYVCDRCEDHFSTHRQLVEHIHIRHMKSTISRSIDECHLY